MIYKWAVEHQWQGSLNTAKFEDYYDALDYASKWNSNVIPWPNDNNNLSVLLSMTEEEDCLQQGKTVM